MEEIDYGGDVVYNIHVYLHQNGLYDFIQAWTLDQSNSRG